MLTDSEKEIIKKFFQGVSIRTLSSQYKGFGRTKIKNLLERYKEEFPDEASRIEEIIKKAKTHKKDVSNYTGEDLKEEQIIKAYEDIKSGKTLTAVSKDLERTRDYIKKQILEYIDDKDEEREFLEILQENQHPHSESLFNLASNEEKMRMIFEKLNSRRAANKRRTYPEHLLERKFTRLKTYFLVTRNEICERKMTEEEFYKMVYETPTLIPSSLSSKIVPAIHNLQGHPNVGVEATTSIIITDASILCSSIDRTNLQIKILSKNNLLKNFFRKPRNFRTSPELLYALIEFKKSRMEKTDTENPDHIDLSNADDVFVTKARLWGKYGKTPEGLIAEYDIENEFGDDEYFDR